MSGAPLFRGVAAAVVALGLASALHPPAVLADPPPPPAYADAVRQAYDIVRSASGADAGPAVQAVRVLTAGTGQTQPEIVADLSAHPPEYADARARLEALLAALSQPAKAADPSLAKQRLRDVMSMSRYDALHRPPSLLERIGQWINDRISALLALLFGRRGGAAAPDWLFFIAGIAGLMAVAVIVFRSARGRLSESATAAPAGPRPAADYFADADRMAARGDHVRALRALCAGVAATLAGERTWEGSPLTVREIFGRAPDASRLRPLLEPFEAAVYGGRAVDRATYERAAEVAAPYRLPGKVAA